MREIALRTAPEADEAVKTTPRGDMADGVVPDMPCSRTTIRLGQQWQRRQGQELPGSSAAGREMAYSWDRLTLADRMGAIP